LDSNLNPKRPTTTMSRPYHVALCGLSAKDSRLIEIVLSRPAPGSNRRYVVVAAADAASADLAVIDLTTPHGEGLHQRLRGRNPDIVPIYVSENGTGGNSRYRLATRMLLLQIQRVLDRAAEEAIEKGKVAQHPRAADATPAEPAAAAPAPASTPGAIDTDSDTGQVGALRPLIALVVDDSETVRQQLSTALERVGVQSRLVSDAEGAISAMRDRSFDLAFLDVVMPGIDGYELCRRIKQDPYTRGMPVLMLTSRSSPFDRARGALAGCDSYLTKPITWAAFCAEVDKALSRRFRNDRQLMTARGYRAAEA
jgi:twitching motility two-component system response regulator PilG